MPWDDPVVSTKTEWLELTWWTDGDGAGRLEAAVYAGGWGGCSEAWFDRQTVLNFANALHLPTARKRRAARIGLLDGSQLGDQSDHGSARRDASRT
jgi:hypothetical protein